MKRSYLLFGSAVVFALSLMGFEGRADALSINSLDFTSGAVNVEGHHSGVLNQLLAEGGSIKLGSYQSITEIVAPITRGEKTFSLFTSGLSGAPAPSASVNGTSISVDLSSLYFGFTRGSEVRAWNIGSSATGLYNPQTSEFYLSWNHLFDGSKGNSNTLATNGATFFLHGTTEGGLATSPVPLSGSVMFFATGIVMIAGLYWRKSGLMQLGNA